VPSFSLAGMYAFSLYHSALSVSGIVDSRAQLPVVPCSTLELYSRLFHALRVM
jgi:hypothetical protein